MKIRRFNVGTAAFFFAAAIASAFATNVWSAEVRRAVTFEEIHAASCRLVVLDASGRSASGSGTNLGVRDGRVLVATNFHVVNGFDSSRVDFFGDYDVYSVRGTVENLWYDRTQPLDFAIVEIPVEKFGDRTIYFVPPAPEDFSPRVGDVFASSGCPGGRNASILKCEIESFYGPTGAVIQYKPAPIPGRSGSGCVFWLDDGLPYLGGVTAWRIARDGEPEDRALGGAIHVKNLYAAVDGRRVAASGSDATPPNAQELVYRFDSVSTPIAPFDSSIPPGAVEIATERVVENASAVGNDVASAGGKKPFENYLVSRFTYPNCGPCAASEPAFARIGAVATTETIDASTPNGARAAQLNAVGWDFPVFLVSELRPATAPRTFARFVGYYPTTETAILTAIKENVAARVERVELGEKNPNAVEVAPDASKSAVSPPDVSTNDDFHVVDASASNAANEPNAVEKNADVATASNLEAASTEAPTDESATVPNPEASPIETPPTDGTPPNAVRVESRASTSVLGLFDEYRTRRTNPGADGEPNEKSSDASPDAENETRRGLSGRVDGALRKSAEKALRDEFESLKPTVSAYLWRASFWTGLFLASFYWFVRAVVAIGRRLAERLPRPRIDWSPRRSDESTGNN